MDFNDINTALNEQQPKLQEEGVADSEEIFNKT